MENKTNPNQISFRGAVLTNVSYMTVDAVNTFLVELEGILKEHKRILRKEDKRRFQRVIDAATRFKAATREFVSPMYDEKTLKKVNPDYKGDEVEDLLSSSDWIAMMLDLLIDRIGDNHQKGNQVYHMLFNTKSELNIYDPKRYR